MKTTARWLCMMIGVGALVCASVGCSSSSSSSGDADSSTTDGYTMTWFYNSGSPRESELPSGAVVTISSDTELGYLASFVNSGDSGLGLTFKLIDNIFLNSNTSDYQTWVTSAPANAWTPIGNETKVFNGTFDGNGKTVFGMYTVTATADYQGLFGNAGARSVIKNLTVSRSYTTGSYFVGSIAGHSDGIISNCASDSIVRSVKGGEGGVVGVSSGTVSSCKNSGTVTTTDTANGWATGGVFGDLSDSGVALDCSNTGTVSGGGGVGGVGGSIGAPGGTANRCVNAGSVTGGSWHCGGIIGIARGKLLNSSSSGSVTGAQSAGGAVGSVGDGDATITGQAGPVENCYSSGSVSATYAGTFAGFIYGTVENCYATGSIVKNVYTVNSFCGCLCTGTHTQARMTNCYWLSPNATAPDSQAWSDTDVASSGSFSSTGGTVTASTVSMTYTGTLLSVLNAWVSAHSSDGCASWTSAISSNGGYPSFVTN